MTDQMCGYSLQDYLTSLRAAENARRIAVTAPAEPIGCPIGPAGPVGCVGDTGPAGDGVIRQGLTIGYELRPSATAPISRELTVPELKKYIFGLVRDLPRADREELVDVLSKEFGK